MKKLLLLIILILTPTILLAQEAEKPNPWDALKFIEGTWTGRGDGLSGLSTVSQEYKFILNNNFIEMTTNAVFKPQEKNPKGEIHEDKAIFSYDAGLKTFVLRAFYVEGFVITFHLNQDSEDDNVLTFESVAVENAPPGTSAKLIYKKLSEIQIEQSFHVAFPGRESSCFVTNRLVKR